MTSNTGTMIWELGADIFESVLFIIFLNHFHNGRALIREKTFGTVMAVTALFLNIMISDSFSPYSAFPFLTDLIIVELYSKRYLAGSRLSHFLGFVLFYLGIFLSITAAALLVQFIGNGVEPWTNINHAVRPLFLAASKGFLLLYVLLVLKMRGKFSCIPSNRTRLSYIIIPFASFIVGLWLIQLIYSISPVAYIKETFLLILAFLLLLLVFIIYLSVYAVREIEKEFENKALHKVMDLQREAVKSLEENRREIWKLSHDIGHRMAAIRFLLRHKDVNRGIEELELLHNELCENIRAVAEGESLGQFIVDSKLEAAQRDGISVRKKIKPGYYQGIDPIDFSIILGNLLDNAIESQKNMGNGKIDFLMDEGIGYIFIRIINNFPGDLGKAKSLSTRKKDKEKHGFGLAAVRRLVDKNGGSFDVEITSNQFTVKLLLREE